MLLLHTCCADCGLKFMESLTDNDFKSKEVTWYYYNPNIHPRSEYLARMKAVKRVIKERQLDVELHIPNYRPAEYFQALNSSLSIKTGQAPGQADRCPHCWRLRLKTSFKYAQENNFKAVSTTLLTSHYQNRSIIKEIGQELAQKYQLDFFIPKELVCDLKTHGFYKQNYCGCCFSLLEKYQQKFKSA